MAQPPLPQFASSGVNVTAPSSGMKVSGWLPGTRPPAQIANWIAKLSYDWFAYLAGIIPDGAVPLKSDTDAEAAQTAGLFSNAERGLDPANTTTFRLADALHMDRVRASFCKGPDLTTTVAFASGKHFTQFASNGAGRIVGVGEGGLIGYSDDLGLTWTVATPDASFAAQFNHVIFANGLFMICGGASGGSTAATIQTSSDGITWTQRLTAANNAVWNLAYNGSLFCAQLWDGTAYQVYWSTNGTTGWTSAGVTTAFSTNPRGVAGGGGLFVKGLNTITASVYTSTDAITWTARTLGSSDIFFANYVAYHVNWGFVVAGTDTSAVNKYLQHSATGTASWTRVRKAANNAKLVTGLIATPHACFVLTESQAAECWTAHVAGYSDTGADFYCPPHSLRWSSFFIGNNVWAAMVDGGTGVVTRVLWID